MARQQEEARTTYPCMAPKDGLRRVHDPRDERNVSRPGPLRRALTKLVGPLRP